MNRALAVTLVFLALAGLQGCGNDDNGGNKIDPSEVLSYVGLAVGNAWHYDVTVGSATLQGEVDVTRVDNTYKDGVDAYVVEIRQNALLVATRWYQATGEGLFLLGEKNQEGSTVVERTFVNPIKIIPYPMEDERGIAVQTWSTESELEQGGSERHRFDNAGKSEYEVPAGTFTAYHLVHTRTDANNQSEQYDEYFSPENWFVQLELPEGDSWQLSQPD